MKYLLPLLCRDCYLVLSDIANGMASKRLDESSNYFLFHCLVKLAEALRIETIEPYKRHLRSLKCFEDLFKNGTKAKSENVRFCVILCSKQ